MSKPCNTYPIGEYPMNGNEYLGFDLIQIRTLQNLLGALETTNTSQATSITNLNAWATALATKLNADAGVTDVNYDTNPQA